MIQGPEDGGSTPLSEYIGTAFGDYSSESVEPSTSDESGDAAGATPAEHPTDTDSQTPPEGTERQDEHADAPSADATEQLSPDNQGDPTSADEDPLAGATPFSYTVNGEQRTYEGIKVLGEHGAVIDASALPDIARRLGERDHLYETNQAQYRSLQQLERLSEWRTTGEDGKEVVIGGQEGLVTGRVQTGRLGAALDTLASVFKPDSQGKYSKLASLIMVNEAQEIVPDFAALQHLHTEADLAEMRAEQAIRKALDSLLTQPSQPSQSSAAPSVPDVAQHAPAIIDQAAKSAGFDAKLLTDKDRSFLASQLPRYIRTVTDADRMRNPSLQLGGPIVDASFADVVKDRAELRAEQSTTVKAVTQTVTNASKENAARLAAAARGVKPQANTPRTPAPKQTQEPEDSDADSLWAMREKAAAQAIRRRSA